MVRRVLVVGLVVAGLLTIGGYFGWSQGYEAGLIEEGTARSYAPFFGIGLFLKFLLVLVLVLLVSKIFFFRRWKHGGGRHGGPWGRHWHEHPYGEPHWP